MNEEQYDSLHLYEKSPHGDYCVCGRDEDDKLHEKPKQTSTKKVKVKQNSTAQKPPKKAQKEEKDVGGRPQIDIDEYFQKLERYLIVGYSLWRACKLGGVPYSTIHWYYKNDPSFSMKVDSLINAPNVKARAVWISKINAGDYGAAKDWLERRERSDFATRQEQTGADGEPLPAMRVIFVDDDDE